MKIETYDAIFDGIIECLMIIVHCILWAVLVSAILCAVHFGMYLLLESWEFSWTSPILIGGITAIPLALLSYAHRRGRQKFGYNKPRDFWMAWGVGVKIERTKIGQDQKIIDEMEDWIKENDMGLHRIKIFEKYYVAIFWNKQDAVSFKIRWQQ